MSGETWYDEIIKKHKKTIQYFTKKDGEDIGKTINNLLGIHKLFYQNSSTNGKFVLEVLTILIGQEPDFKKKLNLISNETGDRDTILESIVEEIRNKGMIWLKQNKFIEEIK